MFVIDYCAYASGAGQNPVIALVTTPVIAPGAVLCSIGAKPEEHPGDCGDPNRRRTEYLRSLGAKRSSLPRKETETKTCLMRINKINDTVAASCGFDGLR